MPGPQTGRNEQFKTISPVPSSIDLLTPLLGHHPMVTSLLDQGEVIIQPMKDGNGKRTFKFGPIITMSCHPWDSNSKNKTNQIPCDKTLLFLVCLASKLRGNQPQAQVAPNGWRTYSANPPKPMSHLFLARVHPPNHMRMFQLVSLNLRWLQHNPWRNLLVSPKFSSPFLQPSPARPTPPHSIIIINDTPVGSPPPLSPSLTPPPSPHVPLPSTPIPLPSQFPQELHRLLTSFPR
ncbi:hypothetical protein O181_060460 [Austropuccinia psidii MF-1]|uniref:Uncharacterized protein n=1 Tax=Austropuccinia psidii MF-1 TaxID=1389203 RepID=A0A9Q3EKI7_9BASI|nr:hypothetical protein [Austropuccinia psidii MF-1]